MELSMQAGRRIQDAMQSWQERREGFDPGKQQYADIRRSRMTCSDRLPAFRQNQDWTGSMGVSPSGRFRVVEQPQERPKIFSRQGIRWNVGKYILIAIAVLLAAMLLAEVAIIGINEKSIERLQGKIEMLAAKNQELETELIYSSGDVTVCTEAVKLNLISSNGAQTVQLTAPQNATFSASASQPQESASGVGD